MNLLFRGVLLVSLLSLSVSAFNSTSTRQKRESTWEENSPYRLSDASFPIHYDLYLKTNVHNEGDRAFSGHVNILVEFRETTDHLKLNTGQIDIKLASISDFEGNLLIANAPTNFGDDFLTVNFLYEFQAGSQYFINIEFQADLRLDGTGFYRSSYEDSSGDTVWYASTNFKPIKARQTFPCYDEPGYRSTFNIEIEHHNSYSALSNMPQESILPVEGSDNVITKFQTTPVMQTHMVAYTISKFGNPIENVSAAPSLNIYTIPSKYYETRFAASHSRKAMDAIENYLKFPYALEKMDQVYLPNMGGSENFGLINYQEPYFLFDEKIHPISRKMNVARLISRQFAHQWFVNVVSQKWWQHSWLDEGLCTLFEYNDLVNPEWRMRDYFITGPLHAVLQTDSMGARSLNIDVDTPEEIASVFDEIGLNKSGAILIMLRNVMTDKTFARGLNLYLKEKHMSSATPQDFYRIMQQAFNEDHPEKEVNISAFMDTWVNQPGYPMITVRREDDTLYISQQRYHQNTPEEVDPVWSIPLSYVTASNPDSSNTTPDLWIHDAHVDINRSEAEKAWTATDWVLFNVQETGYYRVNYDIELWKLLSEELYKGDHTKIHVVNRAQLIDDSFNLAKSEHIPYTILLDFLNYLTHESDYLPWAAADKALSFLNSYLIGSQYYDHFQSMIRYASNSFYERLGAEPVSDEPPLDVLGRNVAINWACLMKHPKCIADTTSLMESLAIGGDSIVPDLESTIYCNGMRVASASTFGTMWSSALYSDNTYLKALILNSLGCSHSSVQLKAYMESSMNPAFIYDELDRVQVISAVYSNGGLLGLNLALDFLVTTNIDELEQTFGQNGLSKFAIDLAERVANAQHKSKLTTFLNKMITQELLSIETSKEIDLIALDRIFWIEENFEAIENWMRYNVVKVSPTYPPTVEALNEPSL